MQVDLAVAILCCLRKNGKAAPVPASQPVASSCNHPLCGSDFTSRRRRQRIYHVLRVLIEPMSSCAPYFGGKWLPCHLIALAEEGPRIHEAVLDTSVSHRRWGLQSWVRGGHPVMVKLAAHDMPREKKSGSEHDKMDRKQARRIRLTDVVEAKVEIL